MLRLAILLACLVPLFAGGAGMATGVGFLGGGSAAADSHVRYLSGLLFGMGVAFAWASFDLSRRASVFDLLSPIIILGGLARLAGLLGGTVPPLPHLLALGMELGVVPLLWWWVRRAMRAHG